MAEPPKPNFRSPISMILMVTGILLMLFAGGCAGVFLYTLGVITWEPFLIGGLGVAFGLVVFLLGK